MTAIKPDDLNNVLLWHFAVGGLQTHTEVFEFAPAVRLQRLKTFPTRTELTNHLNSPLVAGLMQHYGESVVQHELIIDAEHIDEPSRIPSTAKPEPEMEALSEILKLLNDPFGTSFEPEDEEFLEALEQKLDEDPGMAASFAVNTRENARLTFTPKVRDHVQDMIDKNFKFFKQINDKPEFANFLNNILFDRYADRKEGNEPDD